MESSLCETRKRSGSEEDLTVKSPKKVKVEDVERKQEEFNFLNLNKIVLDTIINLKNVSKDDICEAIPEIIDSFKNFTFSNVPLSKWDYSCAYFYRYGSHGAGLTRYKVLEALQNCGDLASKFKESDLNIISLGGGPGNDVIGLCSALYQSKVQSRLNITTVDSVCEWSSYVNLVKMFVKEGNFGNVSKLFHHNDVNFKFLRAKLPGDSERNKKYFQELRKADVILMTKFLSIIQWNEQSDIVESVFNEMKEGAFVLFIDSPFREELWSNFEILYGGLNPQKSESSKGGREEDDPPYVSLATSERFESNDNISSKARLVVLRKK